MCGIAGKVSLTAKNIFETDVNNMTDTIIHRGPDDGGVYLSSSKKVGLGNRRLAIIDLSPKGHMPMSYKDRYWITYNGEIYNHQTERQKLIKSGYRFKSNSDTEVILALYDKYGVKCLDHLRGMFAFAIHDLHKNILFCARDRMGKKPFKYYFDSKVFIFASELKAILNQNECHHEPDFLAIHHFLSLQYIPAPMTGFLNIYKLEPAHFLILNINTGNLVKTRYWQLNFSDKLSLSEDEWCERIMYKLNESVKIRMVSDVPLGAFLSGGIDSSAIVALMAKNSSHQVKTFSIGFEEKQFNELPYAKLIAQRYATDHTELLIKPDSLETILPNLVRMYEEPYADSSALPTYLVSKLAREHVKVALTGDGGDESFAGYPWYPIQKLSIYLEKLQWINNLIGQPITQWLYYFKPSTYSNRLQRFSLHLGEDYRYRYLNYICYFDNLAKQKLYSKGKDWNFPDTFTLIADKFLQANTKDIMDETFYTDMNTYLPDDLLVKVDIATMANSLEARSPFLDHEFIELTSQIPSELKLKFGIQKKYLIKKALKGLLPNETLSHRKQGFMIPKSVWYSQENSKTLSDKLLKKNNFCYKYFDSEYIRQLCNITTSTSHDLSNQIWLLQTLNIWYKLYFSN